MEERCPKCGNTKVAIDKDYSWMDDGKPYYICGGCGFRSKYFTNLSKGDFEKIEKVKIDERKIKITKQDWIFVLIGIMTITLFGIIPSLIVIGTYIIIKTTNQLD